MLALAGQMVLPRCFYPKQARDLSERDVKITRHEYGRMFKNEGTNRRCCDAATALSLVWVMILVFRTAGCAVRQPFMVLPSSILRRLS